jgi:excisionase family DNA binding protein
MKPFTSVDPIRGHSMAERLGMRPDTVTTWIKAGRLKASRIGRFWRIRARDLEAFIDDPPPLHPDRPAAP